MEQTIKNVLAWGEEKGIFTYSTAKDQMLKTVSEIGELADDVGKGRDVRMELGDVLVTLVLQAEMQGTTLNECLILAYEKISKRTGVMQNGIFVREGD